MLRGRSDQHGAAVLRGAARGDAGRALQVVVPRGDPESAGDAGRVLRSSALPGLDHFDALEQRRMVVEDDVDPAGRARILETRREEVREETLRGGGVVR